MAISFGVTRGKSVIVGSFSEFRADFWSSQGSLIDGHGDPRSPILWSLARTVLGLGNLIDNWFHGAPLDPLYDFYRRRRGTGHHARDDGHGRDGGEFCSKSLGSRGIYDGPGGAGPRMGCSAIMVEGLAYYTRERVRDPVNAGLGSPSMVTVTETFRVDGFVASFSSVVPVITKVWPTGTMARNRLDHSVTR